METKNLISMIGYLIEKEYFNLIGENDIQTDIDNGSVSLIKSFQGTSVLLEVIDGDRYTVLQLAQSMENGSLMLDNINGMNATIFKLFLFDEKPDNEKMQIIEQGQVDMAAERKFMKSIVVAYSERIVSKLFKAPNFDANITSTVKRFFSKELYKREFSRQDIIKLIETRKKDFEIQLKAKNTYLTYGLLAANVLMYLIIKFISSRNGVSYGSLLGPFGAKINSLILEGQYWRFFTPMFLHADEVHLIVNCYSLYVLGTQVEKLYGHARFAAIYLVSGIMGCIASFAFSINQSVGASGAIFGLLGAMLFFAVKRPSLLKSRFGANLITMLVINLTYGFMNSQIDNHAHLGGLIGGFLTTAAVYRSGEETSKDKLIRPAALIVAAAVAIGGLLYGFSSNVNIIAPKLEAMETYDGQQNWPESEKIAEEILNIGPSDKRTKIQVLFTLAKAEINQQKYDEGILHSNLLQELNPENGHFFLGFIYYNTQQYDKAKEEFTQAKKYGNSNEEYIDNIMKDIDSRINSK